MISLIEKHLIFQQSPSTRLILRFTKKLVLLQWKGQYLLPKQTLQKNEEILNGKLHFLYSEICLYAGSWGNCNFCDNALSKSLGKIFWLRLFHS